MKQELLDSIKKDYEDYKKMVETNFSEAEDNMITPGRLRRIEKVKEKYSTWVGLRDKNIYDCILDEAIYNNLKEKNLGKTNGILMYISEFPYDIFLKLFNNIYELPESKNNDVYILYIDIEDYTKYFIPKELQKEFEKKHNVIVTYKNPNCNNGRIYDRNMEGLEEIRREFIRSAMYVKQEEAAKVFVKKYKETSI